VGDKQVNIVYFTDLHLWDRDITTRMDRSSETVLGKLEFIVKFAVKSKADVVISGGDLFHDKIDSDEYKARVLRVLSPIADRFYSVVGNHDILWRDYDTFGKRAMGILVAAERMRVLDGQFMTQGILGMSAFAALPAPIPQEASQVSAIFAHHYINHGPDRLVLDTVATKKMFPNLKYIFTGHDHAEYPTVLLDGVQIVRPGGAMRMSTALENTTRQPKLLHLKVERTDWSDLKITEVLIPCLRAEEVFNLDSKAVSKDVEHQLDEFMGSLSESKSVGFDLESVITSKLLTVDDPELREYVTSDIPALMAR
jgi:predicted phosphodiesterase